MMDGDDLAAEIVRRIAAKTIGRSGKIICHSLAGPSSSLIRRKPETHSRASFSPSWSKHCWEAAMLRAALWWSPKGFFVFPLKLRDKRPLGCLVPHGLLTDPISVECGIGPWLAIFMETEINLLLVAFLFEPVLVDLAGYCVEKRLFL